MAEVKVAFLAFQVTPPGISPYFILVGQTQTINHSNSFALKVVSICNKAAKNVGNDVVLNYSTEGVSLEVASNREQQKLYLAGLSDHLSFTDTNHNIKNSWYQEIGGSGKTPALIGRYCFDVMLLKMFGAPRELLRPDDFESDALPLKLAPSNVVRALLELETNDTGNMMVSCVAVCNETKPLSDFFYLVTLTQVTALSLLFTRMRSFAVNCPDAMPHERVFFHWLSTLWFTSFHSFGSTMLPNKRNMVLESVAVLFLATCSNVFKLRLRTSVLDSFSEKLPNHGNRDSHVNTFPLL